MVTFLDPGQMTARLELEAPQAEPDGQGGAVVVWNEVASLWARIEPVSFAVGEEASAEGGTVSHRIWVRFREGLAAGQRFRKGARLFAIKLVRDPDETERYLVCQCEEEAP
ncbi:phage head closure protein [Neorhizobium alkalisoli]|uniref:SPP1 family predicted phage head-tail adaptor n=1 Tax=Neorhizobium alkalisoli TaxID=528178 RepID=A0A561R305_9HYPH|nr:SPP1 family predicted phage head-tail adaptor [Neorhizobium alkalisoli]